MGYSAFWLYYFEDTDTVPLTVATITQGVPKWVLLFELDRRQHKNFVFSLLLYKINPYPLLSDSEFPHISPIDRSSGMVVLGVTRNRAEEEADRRKYTKAG